MNLIKIVDMFNWSIGAGWDTFWVQGVKNYREELAFYEMLSQVGANMVDNASGGTRGIPRAPSNPLDFSGGD